jgi:hypothetical protein
MNIKPFIFAIAIVGLMPAIASAQTKTDPKLDALNYFQGSWTCQAKKLNDTKVDEFTWNLKRSLDGFWFLGAVSHQKKILTHDTLGYNTVSEKFGRTILTSDGRFINAIAEGWQKENWTWEGSLVNMVSKKKEPFRQVIVRKSDREFNATYYTLEMPGQTWKIATQETCRKS